jgi:hypothetical protein
MAVVGDNGRDEEVPIISVRWECTERRDHRVVTGDKLRAIIKVSVYKLFTRKKDLQ